MSIETGMRPRAERLARMAELSKPELVDALDVAMTTSASLGEHLADIAELIGLNRDVEDLAITPRVRALVADPRVQSVLDEFTQARIRARQAEMANLQTAIDATESGASTQLCSEPFPPDSTGHDHRCAIPQSEAHPQGSVEGDDYITDIHRCECGYTWVVN